MTVEKDSKNMEIWSQVCTTDPATTRPYTRGNFNGTAINPTSLIEKATKIWGPCGDGWGYEITNEKFVQTVPLVIEGVEKGFEQVHVLQIRLWYTNSSGTHSVHHFGQTTFVGRNMYGYFVDEDAPKKSLTDALTKALSMLGFSADVYQGAFDDNKYVNHKDAITGSEPSTTDTKGASTSGGANQATPQSSGENAQAGKESPVDIVNAVAKLDSATTLTELSSIWGKLSEGERSATTKHFTDLKTRMQGVERGGDGPAGPQNTNADGTSDGGQQSWL